MYRARTLEACVSKVNAQLPAILVIGPRQVGKTTFLQHLSQDRSYATLDDPILASLAKEEPKLFLQRFKPPVLIDEIQYAPELLPIIKMHIDKAHLAGQYWLTGSQQFHLMNGVSESLAGRVGIINLLGLSQWEARKLPEMGTPFLPEASALDKRQSSAAIEPLEEIYHKIWRGCYPAIVLNNDIDVNLFYSSYVQTYLQRDVRDLANVGNEATFLQFLKAAAARTGQLLNVTDLARDVGVSPNTAKSWLSILQTSGIIYLLEPYHNNLTKRMIKSPKLYFLDTGLCSYLTQWTDAKTLEAGAMSGNILETFVISEIIKSYWHNGLQAPIYYYRDKDKKEIDLLMIQNQTVYPIEIKKTSAPGKNLVRRFNHLGRLGMKVGPGCVICLVDTVLPITETTCAVPVSLV